MSKGTSPKLLIGAGAAVLAASYVAEVSIFRRNWFAPKTEDQMQRENAMIYAGGIGMLAGTGLVVYGIIKLLSKG